jgi:hypothetical protein
MAALLSPEPPPEGWRKSCSLKDVTDDGTCGAELSRDKDHEEQS